MQEIVRSTYDELSRTNKDRALRMVVRQLVNEGWKKPDAKKRAEYFARSAVWFREGSTLYYEM